MEDIRAVDSWGRVFGQQGRCTVVDSRHAQHGLLIGEQTLNGAVVLLVVGDLDMAEAPQLKQHAERVLRAQPDALIVNLLRVAFLGSAGISVLMHTYNNAGRTRIAVVADGPTTRRPLVLLGIDKQIDVYSTMAEAVDGLGMTRADAG